MAHECPYADLPEWARSTVTTYEARRRYDAEVRAIRTRVSRERLRIWRELAA